MHLPWTQVANEVIDLAAPQLASALDWHEDLEVAEALALRGLLRFIRWAVSQCPTDRPPSASALIQGPGAARLIALQMRYRGDPEHLVGALAAIIPSPIVTREAGGIRINGLDRYDTAWRKNFKDEAKVWDERNAKPPPPVRVPDGKRTEAVRNPAVQTSDADVRRRDVEKPPPAGDPAPNVVHLHAQQPEEEEESTFWEFTQQEREKLERTREKKPEGFDAWARTAEAEVGPRRLSAAYSRFLLDDDFERRGWPMPVFMSPKVWRQRANEVRDTS